MQAYKNNKLVVYIEQIKTVVADKADLLLFFFLQNR
jgi:hypothetical protein